MGKDIGMANIVTSKCESCGYKINSHVRMNCGYNFNTGESRAKVICKKCKKKAKRNEN